MFILTDRKSGGVYATNNMNNVKTVHVFGEEDDAQRYIYHLEADEYNEKLEVMEVDTNVIAINCDKYGYNYCIVSKDDLVIPTD